jgi:hypothetical protein
MTESLPIQLLSPLRPELTKLLQKKDQPSAIKEKTGGQKRRRIVNVMHAIERTPPLASASRIMPVASTRAETTTEAETVVEAANLMSTMSGIDKLISDMVAEEAVATAEEIVAAVPGKDKEVVDASSKGKKLTFVTWGVKNYLRQRKRSWKNMQNLAGTSREPCSSVELMRKSWGVSATELRQK